MDHPWADSDTSQRPPQPVRWYLDLDVHLSCVQFLPRARPPEEWNRCCWIYARVGFVVCGLADSVLARGIWSVERKHTTYPDHPARYSLQVTPSDPNADPTHIFNLHGEFRTIFLFKQRKMGRKKNARTRSRMYVEASEISKCVHSWLTAPHYRQT